MCNGCVAQSYWFTLSYHDACYCSFPGLKSNRPPEHHSHFLSHIFKLFHPIAVPLILPLKAHSSHDRINSTWVSLFPYLNLLESPFWHCSPQISFKSRELLVPDFRSSHAVLPFLGSKEQNNQKKKQSHIPPHSSLTLWSYRYAFDCCCRRQSQSQRRPCIGVNEGRFTLIIAACCFLHLL